MAGSAKPIDLAADAEDENMTPAERAAKQAEELRIEKEEQAKLPYTWKQTLTEVDVVVPVPKGTRGKDLKVVIARNKLSLGLKGKESIMEGDLPKPIKVEESFWNIEDQQTVLIHFEKIDETWWPHVLTHHPKIDTKKIQPENSKLSDLDGETRGVVEKMMFDSQQKQRGLPTSDELKKQEMLEKFKQMHPEMDFSNVKMS